MFNSEGKKMINIDELFTEELETLQNELDSGNGVLSDIKLWIDRYKAHLINSNKSINTIELYDVTLKGLYEYIEQNHSSISGISTIKSVLNQFLEWMEQYSVNKRYGTQRERIVLLKKFIDESDPINLDNYQHLVDIFFRELDDGIVDKAEFVIKDFYEYYAVLGGDIDQAKIRGYIESRPKVMLATMNQRRIALVAFLNFIDKSVGSDHFSQDMWRVKHYKLTKRVNNVNTGFSLEDQEKISALLSVPPNKTVALLKRVQGHSEYVEWRTRAMMILMMKAGLRTSEALTIRFEDIVLSKDEKTFTLKVLGKGNKERRVPISRSVFEPYLAYLKEHRIGEYLSATDRGQPQRRQNLYQAIKIKLLSAGISKSGLHIFRHHFGSNFAAKDGNMKILQDLLGHAVITTTMIYSHVSDEVMADAVYQMDEAV